MTLALTVADAGSGTGAATITGSAVGSSNVVYSATWTGAAGALAWTSRGSRTGDGTVSVSPGAGVYVWTALNTATGVTTQSNPVYQPLVDASQSVHYLCLQAIRTAVLSLNLTGISASNVTVKWLPRSMAEVDTMPNIVVAPIGSEQQPGTLTGQDDIGYKCAVVVFDAQNQDYVANLARNLLWRQRIFRAVRHQILSGASTSLSKIITVNTEPGPVLNPQAFAGNVFMTPLVFVCVSREPRGT